MRQFDFISTLVSNMEQLGWEPYQCDHEDANGQFEINWTSDALTTPIATSSSNTWLKPWQNNKD